MSDTSQPYGPNTPAIRRFLVRFAGLGAGDRQAVVTRYSAAATTRSYLKAEGALATAIERSGREPLRDALSGPLLQLVRRPNAPEPTEANALDGLDEVAEPALAALLALLVRDLLASTELEALYTAFHEVIPLADLTS
ncbi:hypothetical protein [Gemmatimonas phototrophica]|uniref:Uncharacterized protein n=1 Tax=Gemmatimonas phototrophica TaxID=1379270 RepID=A0A143BKR4_9BACT|nr:hypothetical protein [Gemmatimonas phototrophica]AMW05203.1 hypothetical protein GEMMAAP_11040 [Gemmatimonas phototrophica]